MHGSNIFISIVGFASCFLLSTSLFATPISHPDKYHSFNTSAGCMGCHQGQASDISDMELLDNNYDEQAYLQYLDKNNK